MPRRVLVQAHKRKKPRGGIANVRRHTREIEGSRHHRPIRRYTGIWPVRHWTGGLALPRSTATSKRIIFYSENVCVKCWTSPIGTPKFACVFRIGDNFGIGIEYDIVTSTAVPYVEYGDDSYNVDAASRWALDLLGGSGYRSAT